MQREREETGEDCSKTIGFWGWWLYSEYNYPTGIGLTECSDILRMWTGQLNV